MIKSELNRIKMRIKRGDTVRVLRGKDRGKTGKVLATFPAVRRVMVEGVNLIHKHVRPRQANEKGQRVSIAAPLRVANVQLVCPQCRKGTRVEMRIMGNQKQRVCKNCGATIDK
jgi:large subunit ribosomal protein L24